MTIPSLPTRDQKAQCDMLAQEIRRRVAPEVWTLVKQYVNLSRILDGSNTKVEANTALDLTEGNEPLMLTEGRQMHDVKPLQLSTPKRSESPVVLHPGQADDKAIVIYDSDDGNSLKVAAVKKKSPSPIRVWPTDLAERIARARHGADRSTPANRSSSPAQGEGMATFDPAESSNPSPMETALEMSSPMPPKKRLRDDDVEVAASRKKGRMVFDGVEMPTRRRALPAMISVSEPVTIRPESRLSPPSDVQGTHEVLDAPHGAPRVKEEPDIEIIPPPSSALVTKPKKLKAKELTLDDETVQDLMQQLGSAFAVHLDPAIRDIAVSRQFMTKEYGGNSIETFPNIREEKLKAHGLDDFMYLNTDYNPNAPKEAGECGLFFTVANHPDDVWSRGDRRVFVRRASNRWHFKGIYKFSRLSDLPTRKWILSSDSVRNCWAKNIWSKGWGKRVRIEIIFRRGHGRDPNVEEMQKAMKSADAYQNLTFDEIKMSFDKGKHAVAVWGMKCTSYPEDFQRAIVAKWETWVPPPLKPKKTSELGSKSTGKTKRATKAAPGEVKKSESDEEDDVVELVAASDESDGEEGFELIYTPRGTRSRPTHA